MSGCEGGRGWGWLPPWHDSNGASGGPGGVGCGGVGVPRRVPRPNDEGSNDPTKRKRRGKKKKKIKGVEEEGKSRATSTEENHEENREKRYEEVRRNGSEDVTERRCEPTREKKKDEEEPNVQHVHERKRVSRDASDANEPKEKHAMGKTTTRRNPSTKEHDRNQRGGK